ncbi:alpha/beta-hydrolase [Salix suchowensis]|nr:alpha/beta-hydrolase [Salix suchowensis]
MRAVHSGLPLLCLLSAGVDAAVKPATVNGPSLTLLFQNSLNHTENALFPGGFIVISDVTGHSAAAACHSLSENPAVARSLSAMASQDLVDLLRFQGGTSQGFWIDDESNDSKALGFCHTVEVTNNGLRFAAAPCSSRLPAVCFSGFRMVSHPACSKTVAKQQLCSIANPPERFEHSTLYSGTQREFDSTRPGAHCVQVGDSDVSEDCLFLNIFTPFLPGTDGRSVKRKPVMFWIHGGAFTGGTGSDATFDGGSLASRGDVVLVTINYRLSTLGFLALNDGVVNGNYGLADQIIALKWVQQHIADFGGDPGQVTIFGQSAGAASVRALLGSPKAKGLFHAAIPMSNLAGASTYTTCHYLIYVDASAADYAATYSKYFTIEEEAAMVARPIISEIGCANDDPAVVRACLLAAPAAQLVSLPDVARFLVVDGTFITSDGLQLSGRAPGVSKVPTMWGWMAFDGAPLIGFPKDGQTLTQALTTLFVTNETVVEEIAQSSSLSLFHLPQITPWTYSTSHPGSRPISSSGARSGHGVCGGQKRCVQERAYVSIRSLISGFSPNPPTCEAPITASHPSGDPSLPYLQCHSGELYYVFGTLGQFPLPFRDDDDLGFNQFILDSWASFARTFDPNPQNRSYRRGASGDVTPCEAGEE